MALSLNHHSIYLNYHVKTLGSLLIISIKKGNMKKQILVGGLLSSSLLGFALPVSAIEFENNGLSGNFDTTISYGAQRRVGSRDSSIVGFSNGGSAFSVNGDNGNLNYDKGLISSVLKVTHDLDMEYGNFGAFFRASYFRDFKNYDNDDLSEAAQDKVGQDAELLDAYISGNFTVGGKALDVRIGKQVVSWGESTFIQNSINAINPIDVSKIRIPGSELREALLPIPMIWASQELTDNVSVQALYITQFDHTDIDPPGTYFSTNDFAGDGGEYVVTGFGLSADCPADQAPAVHCVPRKADRDAKDSGQYGLSLNWFVPEFNETEFGFYFANYHSRLPIISANVTTVFAPTDPPTPVPVSGGYYVEYPEDIKLYGISFNTVIQRWGLALQGEYSHRTNVPAQIEDVELLLSALCIPLSQLGGCPPNSPGGDIPGYERLKIGQLQFTGTKLFGGSNPFGASQIVLLGEVGMTHVYNMPSKNDLRLEGPGTYLPGNATAAFVLGGLPTQPGGYADKDSWGYRLVTKFDYNSALGSANLSPRIVLTHDVNGTSPGPGGNFIEGRKSATVGMGWDYLGQWSGDVSYTRYGGGGKFNLINDRDFVAMNVKYSF